MTALQTEPQTEPQAEQPALDAALAVGVAYDLHGVSVAIVARSGPVHIFRSSTAFPEEAVDLALRHVLKAEPAAAEAPVKGLALLTDSRTRSNARIPVPFDSAAVLAGMGPAFGDDSARLVTWTDAMAAWRALPGRTYHRYADEPAVTATGAVLAADRRATTAPTLAWVAAALRTAPRTPRNFRRAADHSTPAPRPAVVAVAGPMEKSPKDRAPLSAVDVRRWLASTSRDRRFVLERTLLGETHAQIADVMATTPGVGSLPRYQVTIEAGFISSDLGAANMTQVAAMVAGAGTSLPVFDNPLFTAETWGSLSTRDCRVLELLGRGLPAHAVAPRLGLHPKSVARLLARIYAKVCPVSVSNKQIVTVAAYTRAATVRRSPVPPLQRAVTVSGLSRSCGGAPLR